MNRFIFFLLSVFFTGLLKAQTVSLVVAGRVVNASDNLPVAYTNIGVEGTLYGTASNAEGDFSLKIPSDLKEHNLLFSAVGFKNQIIRVSELIKKDQILVLLVPQSYDITEIGISARSQVIYRILRTASEKIPENFQPGAFSLYGSYDFRKVTGDSLVTSRKADLVLNDRTGYSRPDKISAYRDRGYSLQNVTKNFRSYSFPEGSVNLDEMLELDWVRSRSSILSPGLSGTFEFIQAGDQQVDGGKVHVISFRQLKPTPEGSGDYYSNRFEGKIYIVERTFAILKIEGWTEAPKQNRQGRGLAIGKDNQAYLKNVKSEFIVSYKEGIPEMIILNKHYSDQGKPVAEQARIVISGKKLLSPGEPIKRDYFEGE